MNAVKTVLGLAMLAGLPAAVVAAPSRVLLEDPAFHATVSSAMDCSAPVNLILITPDPALLDSDTGDVQRVVDASLAAIRFQCPDITQITVHGTLQGDVQESFIAGARRSNGWAVEPQRTFRLKVPAGATGVSRTGSRPSARAPVLNLAGLEPGMDLDKAREAIASTFNTEPRLLDNGTRLVVEENGCRAGSNRQARFAGAVPGSRCIEAWFTDARYPRLYRVEYAEVVTGRQSEDATGSLVRRYGEPAMREVAVASRRDQPRATRLAWGEVLMVNGNLRHPLQATVSPMKGLTVLEISLYEPGPARAAKPSFLY